MNLGNRYRNSFAFQTWGPPLVADSKTNDKGEFSLDPKRKPNSLRPKFFKTGVASQASGSSYIENGKTKVMCAVYGPHELEQEWSTKAQISVGFKYCVFAKSKRGEYKESEEELKCAQIVQQAIEVSVVREKFPRSKIEIDILVIEEDGGAIATSIQAASLALADAAIPQFDLVTAASAVVVNPKKPLALLDPNAKEESAQIARVMVAYMPNIEEVTHVITQGAMSCKTTVELIDLCTSGCVKLRALMAKCLLSKKTEKENEKLIK